MHYLLAHSTAIALADRIAARIYSLVKIISRIVNVPQPKGFSSLCGERRAPRRLLQADIDKSALIGNHRQLQSCGIFMAGVN
jgi:hypothetical protein